MEDTQGRSVPLEAVCAEVLTPNVFRRWLTTERAVYADIAHTPWAWAARWIDTSLGGVVFLGIAEPVLRKTTDPANATALAVPHWLALYARLPRLMLPVQPQVSRTGAIERLDYIMRQSTAAPAGRAG